jgi:hypothetical protein
MKNSLTINGPAEVPNHRDGDSARARTGDLFIGREPSPVGLGTHDINQNVIPPDSGRVRWYLIVYRSGGLRTLLHAVLCSMVR